MKPMQGQHALVTGANRGIGAAIARHLARAGADVSLLVRTPENAEPLAQEIEAMGVRAAVVGADVTDETALRAAITEAEGVLGPVHALINNAGTAESAPFLKLDDAVYHRMLAVHLFAPLHAIRCVIPGMVARGGGRIVNVASVAGLGGAPYITAYAAAKHAEMGMTRSIGAEFRDMGVKVNAVCPGYVDTDMVAKGIERIVKRSGITADQALAMIIRDSGQTRLATVDEVAEAVLVYSLPTCAVTGEHMTVMGDVA